MLEVETKGVPNMHRDRCPSALPTPLGAVGSLSWLWWALTAFGVSYCHGEWCRMESGMQGVPCVCAARIFGRAGSSVVHHVWGSVFSFMGGTRAPVMGDEGLSDERATYACNACWPWQCVADGCSVRLPDTCPGCICCAALMPACPANPTGIGCIGPRLQAQRSCMGTCQPP